MIGPHRTVRLSCEREGIWQSESEALAWCATNSLTRPSGAVMGFINSSWTNRIHPGSHLTRCLALRGAATAEMAEKDRLDQLWLDVGRGDCSRGRSRKHAAGHAK